MAPFASPYHVSALAGSSVDGASVLELARKLQDGGREAFYRALGLRPASASMNDSAAQAQEKTEQSPGGGTDVRYGQLALTSGDGEQPLERDATALGEPSLQTILRAAMADHDNMMSATFRFHPLAASATAEDYRGLLEFDLDAPGEFSEPLRQLAEAVESCPYCRWQARLTWLREVPPPQRTPLEELERMIVEPALIWRELELAWTKESATVYAAPATTEAASATAPSILCLDGRTGERLHPQRIDAPSWHGNEPHNPGKGNPGPHGCLHLSLFGLPASYSHYRLLLLGSAHLQSLLGRNSETGEGNSGATTEIALPSLDELEAHAPQLLDRLAATEAVPAVVVPQFPGRLTPYGEHSTLTWQSPPIAPVRLRPDDMILCCLY